MDFLKKGVEAAKKVGTKAVTQFKEVCHPPPAEPPNSGAPVLLRFRWRRRRGEAWAVH